MKNFIISCVAVLLLVVVTLTASNLVFMFYFPVRYRAEAVAAAQKFNLPPSLVMAVIRAESGFDTLVRSGAGAAGLMQLMPETAAEIARKKGYEEFSADMLFEAEINIAMGAFYLRYLLDKFGDTRTALAAYNAGEGNVAKWLTDDRYSADGATLKNIPYRETRNYIQRVFRAERIYRGYHRL